MAQSKKDTQDNAGPSPDGNAAGSTNPGDELDLGGDDEATKAEEPVKPTTKKKWLDGVYTFHGKHYGPSKYPGDLKEVPVDFPDDKGGQEPAPEDWRPLPTSIVVPAADPNEVL